MSMTINEIEKEISALDATEKLEILKHLILELDGTADEDVEDAWRIEAERRHKELKEGTVESVPADVVITRAKERLKNEG